MTRSQEKKLASYHRWTGQAKRRNNGFTLLELMAALAILAILASLAGPSFEGTRKRSHIASELSNMVSSVQSARSQALKSNVSVTICASNDEATCSGTWNNGWIIFTDIDEDGMLDPDHNGNGTDNEKLGDDNLIAISKPLSARNTLALDSDTPTQITFNGRGEALIDGPITLRVCGPDNDSTFARGVVIQRSGTPRYTRDYLADDGIHEDHDGEKLSCT